MISAERCLSSPSPGKQWAEPLGGMVSKGGRTPVSQGGLPVRVPFYVYNKHVPPLWPALEGVRMSDGTGRFRSWAPQSWSVRPRDPVVPLTPHPRANGSASRWFPLGPWSQIPGFLEPAGSPQVLMREKHHVSPRSQVAQPQGHSHPHSEAPGWGLLQSRFQGWSGQLLLHNTQDAETGPLSRAWQVSALSSKPAAGAGDRALPACAQPWTPEHPRLPGRGEPSAVHGPPALPAAPAAKHGGFNYPLILPPAGWRAPPMRGQRRKGPAGGGSAPQGPQGRTASGQQRDPGVRSPESGPHTEEGTACHDPHQVGSWGLALFGVSTASSIRGAPSRAGLPTRRTQNQPLSRQRSGKQPPPPRSEVARPWREVGDLG